MFVACTKYVAEEGMIKCTWQREQDVLRSKFTELRMRAEQRIAYSIVSKSDEQLEAENSQLDAKYAAEYESLARTALKSGVTAVKALLAESGPALEVHLQAERFTELKEAVLKAEAKAERKAAFAADHEAAVQADKARKMEERERQRGPRPPPPPFARPTELPDARRAELRQRMRAVQKRLWAARWSRRSRFHALRRRRARAARARQDRAQPSVAPPAQAHRRLALPAPRSADRDDDLSDIDDFGAMEVRPTPLAPPSLASLSLAPAPRGSLARRGRSLSPSLTSARIPRPPRAGGGAGDVDALSALCVRGRQLRVCPLRRRADGHGGRAGGARGRGGLRGWLSG